MRSGDFTHDRKAESNAVGPTGDEGFEQVLADRRRRTIAIVMHGEGKRRAVALRGEQNGGIRRRRLNRVEDEIVEGVAHLFRIEFPRVDVGSRFKRNALGVRKFAVRRRARLQERREPDARRGASLLARVTLSKRRNRSSSRSTCPRIDESAWSFRAASPAIPPSAFNRIAAIGLRNSWATPAAKRPIAARRSPCGESSREIVGAQAREREALTGVVQRGHDPIEFAFAGHRQGRKPRNFMRLKRRFDAADMARPAQRQSGEERGGAQHRGRKDADPCHQQPIAVAGEGEHPRHRPSCQPGDRPGERACGDEKDLRGCVEAAEYGTALVERLAVYALDARQFGDGLVRLRTRALIGWEGIGEPAIALEPDAALDP